MKHILFTLTLLCLHFPIYGAEQSDFHPPQSEPEKLLDQILLHGYSSSKSPLLTRALHKAIAKTEKDLIKATCGDKPIPGDLCGFEVNPITCSQDENDRYLYKTISISDHEAIIAYSWPQPPIGETARYRIIKTNAKWQLDAIFCHSLSFNGP